jgi:Protein of unknown function (DUF1194)
MRTIAVILLAAVFGFTGGNARSLAATSVDAAIITAIDSSDSIGRHEEWLQLQGLARAVVAPVVLDAIRNGHHRRIAFCVFAWSSAAQRRLLVPWTLIDGDRAAMAVASALHAAPWIRRPRGGDDEKGDGSSISERPTDVSAAIDLGVHLLSAADAWHPVRRVLNIVSNGTDNAGVGPGAARARALAGDIRVNAVVVTPRPDLVLYFRREVVGGAGSFVLQVATPENFNDVMLAKLLMDLISAIDERGGGPG